MVNNFINYIKTRLKTIFGATKSVEIIKPMEIKTNNETLVDKKLNVIMNNENTLQHIIRRYQYKQLLQFKQELEESFKLYQSQEKNVKTLHTSKHNEIIKNMNTISKDLIFLQKRIDALEIELNLLESDLKKNLGLGTEPN